MTDPIRVVIAEDSPTVRAYLHSLMAEVPGLQVIGMADNGEDAVALVQRLRPDVVSMDIRMPRLDGLEATRRIMAACPTPVVIVSGMLELDIALSLQALQAGALAVVARPPDRQHPEFPLKRQQLITTLRAMAGVRVIARRERLWQEMPVTVPALAERLPARRALPEVLALGASTGGPSALHRILGELPEDFPLPVVIVQHMPHEFIGGLARWLAAAARLPLSVADDTQPLRPGHILLAPGTAHLQVERGPGGLVARLLAEKGSYRYQPAVDVLFESVARACGSAAIGVVLTGMGDDGAAGLLAMRRQGAYTVGQDEASSTVYGMPAAAAARGAVELIEPLGNIAPQILKLVYN
ncbi:MAG: chemotaxis-specific protein-glutamate methyltransferase CheB [Anaerolineae bacterium]|jgi:two-component system chemotaxis response regulator CheB|nr:chemotaxis-specific protein-glutamate methyltransferase CheB [Anaerolineae bacterium]